MDEETGFEILCNNLENRKIEFSSHVEDKLYLLLYPDDPMSKRKFITFRNNDLYFVAYDSYSTKAYDSTTFTGLYGVIDKPKNFNLRLYKKHWIDLILRKNKIKTGDINIDSKLTITSNLKTISPDLFSAKAIELFLRLNDKFAPFKMIIENDYITFIKDLKGKILIGIETDNWVYKDEQLDILLDKGEALLKDVMERMISKNNK